MGPGGKTTLFGLSVAVLVSAAMLPAIPAAASVTAGDLFVWSESASNTWSVQNVTAAAGGATIFDGSSAVPLADSLTGNTEVYARASNSDLVEYWGAGGTANWHFSDLTAITGGPVISSQPAVVQTSNAVEVFAMSEVNSRISLMEWRWTPSAGWSVSTVTSQPFSANQEPTISGANPPAAVFDGTDTRLYVWGFKGLGSFQFPDGFEFVQASGSTTWTPDTVFNGADGPSSAVLFGAGTVELSGGGFINNGMGSVPDHVMGVTQDPIGGPDSTTELQGSALSQPSATYQLDQLPGGGPAPAAVVQPNNSIQVYAPGLVGSMTELLQFSKNPTSGAWSVESAPDTPALGAAFGGASPAALPGPVSGSFQVAPTVFFNISSTLDSQSSPVGDLQGTFAKATGSRFGTINAFNTIDLTATVPGAPQIDGSPTALKVPQTSEPQVFAASA